jgi:predicted transcriptional regulator
MSNEPFVVTSASQLLTIASPGREEIVDAVGFLGPSTVPEIAAFLGRSRHSLYYHVRALLEAGLLVEEAAAARGKGARYDLPGRPLVVRYDLATPGARRAVAALARSRLRSGARGFVRGSRPELAVTEGPRRNLWVTHWKGWLSDEELEEANALLARLVDLFRHDASEGRDGRRPLEITFALAPIPEGPATRPAPAATKRRRTERG